MDLPQIVSTHKADTYLMIGSPITQVKSPAFFNQHFREHGIDAEMLPLDLSRNQLGPFFDAIRNTGAIQGCIVTVPYKHVSYQFMDIVSERARILQSINVVRAAGGQLSGDIVDGLGFINALRNHPFEVKKKRIALVGAGAAGSAIALALSDAGASQITIKEKDENRYSIVQGIFKNAKSSCALSSNLEDLSGFDLAVNATPVGMKLEDELPFPLDGLAPDTLVAEIVTKPHLTPWLRAAMHVGCPVLYGEEMVYGQIALIGKHMGLQIPESIRTRAD